MTRKQSRVSSKHKQRDETQKKDIQNNNLRRQNKRNKTHVRWIQKNKRRQQKILLKHTHSEN